MGFKKEVKDRALIECKRHCVLCEKDKGKKIECHHIVPQAEGGEDTFNNCIPLCFDCHEEVGAYNIKHPRGTKFSSEELRVRRDNFYTRVKNGEFPIANFNEKQTIPKNTISKSDIKLLKRIKKYFNEPNIKYYLTEYDFGNDFPSNVFDPLENLYLKHDDPEFEFDNADLEKLKIDLFSSIYSLVNYIAFETFRTNIGTQANRAWKDNTYTDVEKRKINKEFNDTVTNVWNSYKVFIKSIKKIINE